MTTSSHLSQSDINYVTSLSLPTLKRMKTSSYSSNSLSSAPVMTQTIWQDHCFSSSTSNPNRIFLFFPRKHQEKIKPLLNNKAINTLTTALDSSQLLERKMNSSFPKGILSALDLEIDLSSPLTKLKKLLKSLSSQAKTSRKIRVTFVTTLSSMSDHILLVLDFLARRCSQVEHVQIQLEHSRIPEDILRKLNSCLKKLASLKSLSLILCGNHLYFQDLETLTKLISRKNRLQRLSLNLNNNKLNDQFLMSLMSQILTRKTLEMLSLSLSFNPVTERGVGKLVIPLEELKERLQNIFLNLQKMECDNIAYFRRLFSQFEENKKIKILY